jgi:hypothetical protein
MNVLRPRVQVALPQSKLIIVRLPISNLLAISMWRVNLSRLEQTLI